MTALPVAIGSLVNLEELKIAGNALRDPPMKIINGGIKIIRDYLSYNIMNEGIKIIRDYLSYNIINGGIKIIRDYLSYNVRYETDQSDLAPARNKSRGNKAAVRVETEDACKFAEAFASSTAVGHSIQNAVDGGLGKGALCTPGHSIQNAVDGGLGKGAFWQSLSGVENVHVE
ncbi:hypothetical protein T484DRAFT_1799828, partial [Baffinella frigidus]